MNRIVFGLWSTAGPAAMDAEEVVYCCIAEQRAELHCHGGAAAVSRVLADLRLLGANVVTPAEYATQIMGAVVADVELTLARAATARTAQLLLQQRELFPQAVAELQRLDRVQRQQRVDEMLAWWWFGKHLIEPWRVVLCGAPNVGKSTLMNALVGYERAIVFDQPGTTRDVLTAETALAGWPVQLMDTAGLRETSESLEAEGIQKARERVRTADLVIVMHDATAPHKSARLKSAILPLNRHVLQVWNKIDRSEVTLPAADDALAISALRGHGVEQLQQAIVDRLVPRLPPEGLAIPCSQWQYDLLRSLAAIAES